MLSVSNKVVNLGKSAQKIFCRNNPEFGVTNRLDSTLFCMGGGNIVSVLHAARAEELLHCQVWSQSAICSRAD